MKFFVKRKHERLYSVDVQIINNSIKVIDL